MIQDIFIGIDGGGSKSKVRVEDSSGNVLGQAVSGPANVRLSTEGAWRSIYAALEGALQPKGIALRDKSYRFHAGLGLAGCEVPEAVQAFLKYPHHFSTLELSTDAHIACLGAHNGSDGTIIIAGTGVIGYQLETGKGTRVSGWGFPHDDEGGGAWLGLEAVRLTFQWLDQRTEKSPLIEDIFAYFNKDQGKFVTWANSANSSEFARLAPIVVQHSQQKETHAVCLMKKAAQAIEKVAHALTKMRVQKQPLPCCLVGGIAPFIKPWLSDGLSAALTVQQGDANRGAILMIRQRVKKERV